MRIPILDRLESTSSKRWAVGGTCMALGLVALGIRAIPRSVEGRYLKHTVGIDMAEMSASAQGVLPSGQARREAADLTLKRIQKANLRIEVVDLLKAREAVVRMTGELGGYVAASRSGEVIGSAGSLQLNLQIPAGRFDEAVADLERRGKVLDEQRSVEDITRAYVDLEARLRNKRVSQARIRDILATRTGKIADVVEAEQALSGVTEEIERMEAQRRVYDHEVAFGFLDITLQPRPIPRTVPPWWAPLGEGLRASGDTLANSALGLAQLFAFLLPWGLLITPLILWFRRKARLQSQPQL